MKKEQTLQQMVLEQQHMHEDEAGALFHTV